MASRAAGGPRIVVDELECGDPNDGVFFGGEQFLHAHDGGERDGFFLRKFAELVDGCAADGEIGIGQLVNEFEFFTAMDEHIGVEPRGKLGVLLGEQRFEDGGELGGQRRGGIRRQCLFGFGRVGVGQVVDPARDLAAAGERDFARALAGRGEGGLIDVAKLGRPLRLQLRDELGRGDRWAHRWESRWRLASDRPIARRRLCGFWYVGPSRAVSNSGASFFERPRFERADGFVLHFERTDRRGNCCARIEARRSGYFTSEAATARRTRQD